MRTAMCSSSRNKIRVLGIYLLLASIIGVACAGAEPEHEVAIFVQATKSSEVNQKIMGNYVWKIVRQVLQVDGGAHLEVYPLTANTLTSASIFSARIRQGLQGRNDSSRAIEKFRTLKTALDRVYPGDQSELIDILGSVFLIDSNLGSRNRGWLDKPLTVIYITNLVQQTGADGWDFSIFAKDSQNIEACKAALEKEYGSKLEHRDRFAKEVQVLIIRLPLEKLYSDLGVGIIPPQANSAIIDDFWKKEFFGRLLRSTPVEFDNSGDPASVVQSMLD